MPFEVVAEQTNTAFGTERRDYTAGRHGRGHVAGGNFRTGMLAAGGTGFYGRHRGYLRHRYGDRGDSVLGCMIFSVLAGLALTGYGADRVSYSTRDTRNTLLTNAKAAIAAWGGESGPTPANSTAAGAPAGAQFVARSPVKFGVASSSGAKPALDRKGHSYTAISAFGEPANALPAWDSYGYTITTSPTPITAPTVNTDALDIRSTAGGKSWAAGESVVGGQFKMNVYRESQKTWNCHVDTAGEGIGGTKCKHGGNSCGMNVNTAGPNAGCPHNQPRWSGGSTQWGKVKKSGTWKCMDYSSCFCMCTAGKHRNKRIPTSYYPGGYNPWTGQFLPARKVNCLDLSQTFCGTPSKAAMLCNLEPIKTTTCKTQCSRDGGRFEEVGFLPANVWGGGVPAESRCTITTGTQLDQVCLMASSSSSARGTAAMADALPGCLWDNAKGKLVSTRYVTRRGRPSKTRGVYVKVMSPSDPMFTAGKLTDPPYCNLRPSPDQCFGDTPAQALTKGLLALVPGLVLLFWPCAAAAYMSQHRSKFMPQVPVQTTMQMAPTTAAVTTKVQMGGPMAVGPATAVAMPVPVVATATATAVPVVATATAVPAYARV